ELISLMKENIITKIWRNAIFLSKNTPDTRNRFVDFLRILSIMFVVIGHWLIVTAVYRESGFYGTDVLSERPELFWLTWILQIMPVFFIVGGYANSISWNSHQKKEGRYEDWLVSRLRRLVWPIFPLILVWVAVTMIANWANFEPGLISVGSLIALQPVWFLLVYFVIVVFTPFALKIWKKAGIWSFWGLAAFAATVDVLRYVHDLDYLGWLNYLFIWLAVHQLGIAWQDGFFKHQKRRAIWAIGGFIVLSCLVYIGPYPSSMVNVPGDKLGNLFPPSIAMLALGAFQGGTLLLLEDKLNSWLSKEKPWAVIVLLNGMSMTIFLWHVTVNALVMGAAFLLGGVGLKMDIGSFAWWMAKFIWIPVLALVLLIFVLIFSRFERPKQWKDKAVVTLPGLFIRTIITCFGLGMLALGGISGDGWFGLNIWALVIFVTSYFLLNFSPKN
ncbi:MAG: acyltransferase, partial [Candidatus Heimdallarchaeota archaeon]|nr:acyltransferase [Candidatus Heimdallarchaeota archaeon]